MLIYIQFAQNAFNVSVEHKQINDQINRPLRLGLIEFQNKLYGVAKFDSKNVICGVVSWIISGENQEQINGILINQNSFNQHFIWQNYDRQNLPASLNKRKSILLVSESGFLFVVPNSSQEENQMGNKILLVLNYGFVVIEDCDQHAIEWHRKTVT